MTDRRARDLDVVRRLVRVASPTGSVDKAVATLVDIFRERGFDEAYVDEVGNAVGVAGRGPREILLVGHIDTVPGDLPVREEDGVLWGRGSVDAKGPLAAFTAAASRFAGDPRVRIVVVGSIDEEAESEGAKSLIPRYRPETLVIGEPSGVDGVTIGYKGIVKIRYVLEEDLAHTGAPFPTVADRGLAFWSAVQGFLAPLHGESLFDTPTAKLTSFNTTLLPNGRDHVEIVGNVRIPPGFDAPAFLDFLKARAGPATVDIAEVDPAWVADKSSAVARSFIAAVRANGLTPRYVKKTGTSDMNILAPAWNVPCVAYGPGDASLDHTPQERLVLSEYLASVEVLADALERLASGF
ncbi:MAG TPA: [LysW]-lysine hydrolase [Candidatus Thermoplasmatota archaeon]|nr:[LysW]-lysine hydrolase [Candidatus Thermoplasmatota archaeon]